MKKKVVTVVLYNLRGWNDIMKTLSDRSVQEVYSTFLSTLLRELQAHKGVPDSFSGDHILAAHNAFSTQATHKVAGCQAAVRARNAIDGLVCPSDVKLTLSFAAVSGECKVGQMGCQGMRKVTISSSILPWVSVLESFNNTGSFLGTIDASIGKDVGSNFQLRQIHVGQYAKRHPLKHETCMNMFEVVEALEAGEEEWMYQMNEAEQKNPFWKWNSIFELMTNGHKDSAKEIIEATHANGLIKVSCALQTPSSSCAPFKRSSSSRHSLLGRPTNCLTLNCP